MFKHSLPMTIVAIVLFAGSLFAEDRGGSPATRDTASVQDSFTDIVALGPGVHHIKTTRDGQVRSCIVVGQSRISTVLGKANGLQTARSRARLAAAAEFVKWLRQDVDVRETAEDETVLFLEGSKKGAENALQESGKSVEKNTFKFTATAQGLVRGLQVLHVDIDAEERIYTVVLGWTAEGAAAARNVESDEKLSNGGSQPQMSAARAEEASDVIRSRNATAKDAWKFLE